jgi:hypothetical protein
VDQALWLLLRLRLSGWPRRFGRSVATVKGAVLVLLGILLIVLWLLPSLLTKRSATVEHLEGVRRFGPLGLFVYLIITLISTAGERAVSFNPAEVNFLFAGPFTRRQLLGYKIVHSFGISMLIALMFAVLFREHAALFLAAYVGLVLALLFIQLFAMTVTLLASILRARAYTRWRQVVVLALILLAIAVLFQAGKDALALPVPEILRRMEETTIWQTILAPLRWLVETFTAERLWPDLMLAATRAVGVDLFLLVVVFVLDANYLETAAAAGERIYAKIQRLRSGTSAWGLSPSAKARFSLPSLPYWGGIGPIAWRQLLGALRQWFGLVFVFVMLGLMTAGPTIAAMSEKESVEMAPILGSVVVGMTIFITLLVPFDFRGDLDRFDLLKTLPIPASRLAVGMLFTPVFLVSVMQCVVLAVCQAVMGRVEPMFFVTAAFVVPFNFLLFGIDNVLFLWYPFRLVQGTAGDFQTMGRHLLFFLLKFLALLVTVGGAALVAWVVYAIPAIFGWWNSLAPAVIAGWLMLTGFALSLVPILALAFTQFDVARDTPP